MYRHLLLSFAMPELPEVETIARTLAPQVTGRRIMNVHVLRAASLAAGGERLALLAGARIERVFRRAKLLLLSVRPGVGTGVGFGTESAGSSKFSANAPSVRRSVDMDELLLVFHLKMTGRFFVHPADALPLKHTRLIFDLDAGDAASDASHAGAESPWSREKSHSPLCAARLFFDDMRTFGYCRIMLPDELPQWPFWKNLGVEPLDTHPDQLAQVLSTAFARRTSAVKGALLDQTVVAGIGNIYADEALFRAGIAPGVRACTLAPDRILRLAHAVRDILELAVEGCGSSIRDYRDALGNAGAFQNYFAVYGRKGERCTVCDTPLTATRTAGRGTVFCPHCQT